MGTVIRYSTSGAKIFQDGTENDKFVIPSEVEERQKIGIPDAFFYDEPLWKRDLGKMCLLEVKKFIDKIGEVEERKEEERSSKN